MIEPKVENIIDTPVSIPNANRWSKITATIFSLFTIFWLVTFLGIASLDFSVFFLLLSCVTGFYWWREKKFWSRFMQKDKNGEWERPWWLSWTAGIFPVVLALFLFRGFIAEPFKIPTGSMIPTIMIGDVSIINKFYYDIKIPVIEKSIYKNHEISRGDIVVFRYPKSPSTYYIKRFVGLPGDKFSYDFYSKEISINGKIMSHKFDKKIETENGTISQEIENLDGVEHKVWNNPQINGLISPESVDYVNECKYTVKNMTCIIPKNSYFAMGDNRDNSLDSRYWGFVPEKNIIGKATLIAFSTTSFSQLGWLK
jgi:signal peptidase I